MADKLSGGDEEDPFEVDLFGAPVGQIRERWGRPSYAKTKDNQQLVAGLRSAGWSQARIARHIGCDQKTLRKHFSRELDAGADLIEGMAIQVLIARMRQGHMQATRTLMGVIERGRALPPASKPDEPGKKEMARRAAERPPEDWGELLEGEGPKVH